MYRWMLLVGLTCFFCGAILVGCESKQQGRGSGARQKNQPEEGFGPCPGCKEDKDEEAFGPCPGC